MSTGASSLASPSTLVGLLWPSRDDARFTALRAIVLMIAGTALLTISAKVQVPLPYVPLTLQTLVALVSMPALISLLNDCATALCN